MILPGETAAAAVEALESRQLLAIPAAPSSPWASGYSPGALIVGWRDNSSDETDFLVQYATNYEFTYDVATLSIGGANVSTPATASTLIAGLIPGASYYVRIRAANAEGSSAYTDPPVSATATVGPATAGTPTGLSASVISATQIGLSWTDVVGGQYGYPPDDSGYVIERATRSDFQVNYARFPVGHNATGYQDTGLTANTTYYYRLRSVSSNGWSAPSTTVAVTTAAGLAPLGVSVAEGGSGTLGAGGTVPAGGSVAWDLDGDGVYGETGAGAGRGEETGTSPSFSAAGLDGPGAWTVGLRTFWSDGSSDTRTGAVTITNAVPSVSVAAPYSLALGAALTASAVATDASGADEQAGFGYSWSVQRWTGAGETWQNVQSGTGALLTYTPLESGMYQVSFTVHDKDGGQATVGRMVAVTQSLWDVVLGTIQPTATVGSELWLGIDEGDADQDVYYRWTVVRSDEGGSSVVMSDQGFWSSFTPDQAGQYQVILHAYSAQGYQGVMDTKVITALELFGSWADPDPSNGTDTPVGGSTPGLDPAALSVSLSGTVLVIDGSDSSADTIFVMMMTTVGGQRVISVRQGVGTAAVATLYSADGVESLWIRGFGGNDNISLATDDVKYGQGTSVLLKTTIDGGEGDDTLGGGKGADSIIGDAGDDSIRGDAGNDTIHGGVGDDSIMGNTQDDSVFGDDGNDTIKTGLDSDWISGGQGNDSLIAGDASDTIFGDAGNDYIEGKGKADTVEGGGGDDTISGGAGNDSIRGGTGNDRIYGQASWSAVFSDSLFGEEGNDRLYGSAGSDSLSGGDGDDTIDGGSGISSDTFDGGSGTDTADYTWRGEDLFLTLDGVANDGALGERDNLLGIERVWGGVGNDSISGAGSAWAVSLDGGLGNDTLIGGSHNDTLIGGDGNDALTGAGETDQLTGGAGLDTYDTADLTNSYPGRPSDLRLSNLSVPQNRTAFLVGTLTASDEERYDTRSFSFVPESQNTDQFAIVGNELRTSSTFTGTGSLTISIRCTDPDGLSADNTFTITVATGPASALPHFLSGGADNDVIDVTITDAQISWSIDGSMPISAGRSTFSYLIVSGGGGDDRITITDNTVNSRLAVSLSGGDGRDTLIAGKGDDALDGGAGKDELHGGDGNDAFITLDDSIDTVWGEAGVDTVLSSNGLDSIGGMREFYVSSRMGTNSEGGTYGTRANPWKTIAYGLSRIAPGDTLYIDGGNGTTQQAAYRYDLSEDPAQIAIGNGRVRIQAPNITLQGYNSNRPAAEDGGTPFPLPAINLPHKTEVEGQPTVFANYATIDVEEGAYNARLRYLDVSGGYYAVKVSGKYTEEGYFDGGPSGLLLEGCSLHDTLNDVVKLTPGSDRAVIRGNRIYNSGLYWQEGYALSDNDPYNNNDPNAEGIDAVNADDCIAEDNEIYHIASNGVYFKGGSRNAVIQRNYIHEIGILQIETAPARYNNFSGIILGQHSDFEDFDHAWGAIWGAHYESVDGAAINNIIADCGGCGVGVWAAKNASVLNNTMVNVGRSGRAGVQIEGQLNWVVEGRLEYCPSTNVIIRNNIIQMWDEITFQNAVGMPVISVRYAVPEPQYGFTGADGLVEVWPTVSNNAYYVPGGTARFADERWQTNPIKCYAITDFDGVHWDGTLHIHVDVHGRELPMDNSNNNRQDGSLDPKLETATSAELNHKTVLYYLKSDSWCIGHGLNLRTPRQLGSMPDSVLVTDDYGERSRPEWPESFDIGAVQYPLS